MTRDELIELLKSFPDNLEVNVEYDGTNYPIFHVSIGYDCNGFGQAQRDKPKIILIE